MNLYQFILALGFWQWIAVFLLLMILYSIFADMVRALFIYFRRKQQPNTTHDEHTKP